MSRRGGSRGHRWLIFWALADCVSNGALIAFGPPLPQNKAPEKSIQIPTRGAEEEKEPIFKMQRALWNKPNVRFKSDIFEKKTMPTLSMTASSKYQ